MRYLTEDFVSLTDEEMKNINGGSDLTFVTQVQNRDTFQWHNVYVNEHGQFFREYWGNNGTYYHDDGESVSSIGMNRSQAGNYDPDQDSDSDSDSSSPSTGSPYSGGSPSTPSTPSTPPSSGGY